MPDFEFVDSRSFERLSATLLDDERIGLDTEFMRETTFVPELCLVQIAAARRIYCADPLGAEDLDPFWQALADRCWVVHSGRQDIEVYFLAAGQMPRDLFDTQIAAGLLGYAPQLGYAALVAELFGVALAKSHTRADWRRRPLPQEYLEYAAEDVEYLLPACDVLTAKLTALGRLQWAVEDSRDLIDSTLYAPDPATAVERLKGARNLRGWSRRIAVRLAEWRETQALRLNRPRQWILRDAALLEIAVAAPRDDAALQQIPALPPKTARRAGPELLALVAAAEDGPDDYEPPARQDESQKNVLKEMQRRVAATAARVGIVPEIIAPRKELSDAVSGTRNLRLLKGWRRELIGDELLALIEN